MKMNKNLNELVVEHSDDFIIPGKVITSKATFNGVFKKVERVIGFSSNMYTGDIITFKRNLKEFEVKTKVKIQNSEFESENSMQLTDDVEVILENDVVYFFELESEFYIKEGEVNVARVQVFKDGASVAGVRFKCATSFSEEGNLHDITLKVTVLKREEVTNVEPMVLQNYNGADNMFAINLGVIGDLKKINNIAFGGVD